MRYFTIRLAAVALTFTTAGASALAASLTPLSTFGGGDGWRAPYEVLIGDSADAIVPDPSTLDPRYRYLGNALTGTSTATINPGNLERGLAYNPATGHLILVSRNDSGNTLPSIRILDSTTGVDIGTLNKGTGVLTGGTFAYSMIGAAEDGAIYLSNLTTNATTTPYKLYRWASESATPTVAFDGVTPLLAGARMGDSLDVIGSGINTRLVAGFGNSPAVPGNNSFALLTTSDGVAYTGSSVALSATPPNAVPPAGNFRLGITFRDSDTVVGKSDVNAVSIVDLNSTTAGNVTGSFSTDGISLKPMDFAIVGGKPIIALIEATADTTSARARLFVYDMTDLSLPLAERQIAVGTTLPLTTPPDPTQFANLNGTGQVKFGAINGNVATIYAMSTNNGIEAFTLTLDPPSVENADFDSDGDVDGADFLTWQQNLGISDGSATSAMGDANGDGNVTAEDLTVWTTQFGPAGGAVAVPEARSASLAVFGAALTLCSLKRRRIG
jgi:hypothetical protein